MNHIVNQWLEEINNNQTVIISSISELTTSFPEIDFSKIIPEKFYEFNTLEIIDLFIETSEDTNILNSLEFTLSSSESLLLPNNNCQMSDLHILFTIDSYDENDFTSMVALKGNLIISDSELTIPAIINIEKNKSLLEFQTDEIDFTTIDNEALQKIIGTGDILTNAPENISDIVEYSLVDFIIQFDREIENLMNMTFKSPLLSWSIYSPLLINMRDLDLRFDIKFPCTADEITYTLAGTVYAGESELPEMTCSFSGDKNHRAIALKMTGDSYPVEELNIFSALLPGCNLKQLLPESIQGILNFNLTGLHMEISPDGNGFKKMNLSFVSGEEDETVWEIIPDTMSMKNFSFEFDFVETELIFKAIGVINSQEYPLAFSYKEYDENHLIELILDNEMGSEITLPIENLIFPGISFLDKLPGLDNYAVSLSSLYLTINYGDEVTVDNFIAKFGVENNWTVIPGLQFKDFDVTVNYNKVETESLTNLIVDAILLINTSGASPMPVRLSIPHSGDWILELGSIGSSDGIVIPGLQGIIDLVQVDISDIVPQGLTFDGIRLSNFSMSFSPTSDQKINNVFGEFILIEQWSFTDQLILKDLVFQVEISFADDGTVVNFQLKGNLVIGGIEVKARVQKTSLEWILVIESSEINLSLDSLMSVVPFMSSVNLPDFIDNIFDVNIKVNSFKMVYNSSMDTLKEYSFNISLDKPWVLGDNIMALENLSVEHRCWNIGLPESENAGNVYCTFKVVENIIPLKAPLPYNSQQYTFQLYDNATLSTLSDFIPLVKFNPNYYLSLLPGFEIPSEITISRFDIKLDDETNEVEKLQVTADFGEGVTISLPPGLEITMNSLDFVVTNAGSYYNQDEFIVRGAITETIGSDTTIYVKVVKEDRHWHVTMDMTEGYKLFIGGSLLENIIPGLNIPSFMEDLGVEIESLYLHLNDETEVEEFNIDFAVKGFDNIMPGDILKEEVLIRALYEDIDGTSRWGIQLLDWPFQLGLLKNLAPPLEEWVLIDLGEFGAIRLELPKLIQDGENLIINGEIKVTHDGEEIPLENGEIFTGKSLNIPVDYILDKLKLSIFKKILPDKIPLVPETDLGGIIEQAGGDRSNLPESFQDYLDISVPDGIQYDLFITSSGDISVKLSLPDEELNEQQPLKILATDFITFLTGVKLYHAGFSIVKGYPFFTIDAEIDNFLLPVLVALTYFDTSSVEEYIDLKDINFHLNIKDVWLLLTTIIPIPLFYQDISFKYTGLEGVTIESGIEFPKPGLNISDFSNIYNFLDSLKLFFTDSDYLLDPSEIETGDADLKFTLAPTYVESPKYLGENVLGTKDDVFTRSAVDILCHTLNTLKKPSLTKLIKLIDPEYRCLNLGLELGPIKIDTVAGVTTPLEFVTDNPAGFSYSLLNRLFPDLDTATPETVTGNEEKNIPVPEHYLECSEGTGNLITDKITALQLSSENGKSINWEKESIKGYGEKYYITNSTEDGLTSIVTGDIIDEPYSEYTISFLAKVSEGDSGCVFASRSGLSIWYWGGIWDVCGGVKINAVDMEIDSWKRITVVQSATKQQIYVDRVLSAEEEIYMEAGTDQYILGALNEEFTVDLPQDSGVFTGKYADILIYGEALTVESITALCDHDDNPSVRPVDSTTVEEEGEKILTVMAGNWNIGSLISSQVIVGLSIKDFTGAGAHVGLVGSIGDNFLGLDISGVCQVDIANGETPFLINLNGSFCLFGKKVIHCIVEFTKEHFYFKGEADLFDWTYLTARGLIEGELTKNGNLSLTGDLNLNLCGVELLASAHITNSSISLSATLFSEMELSLKSAIGRDGFYIRGGAEATIGLDYHTPTLTIDTPYGDIEIGTIHVDIGIGTKLNFEITHAGVRLKAEASFNILGKDWDISITLSTMPSDYNGFKKIIKDAAKHLIESSLFDVPAAMENFIEWAKIAWHELVDYAERVSKVLKDAFNKTYGKRQINPIFKECKKYAITQVK